MNEAQRKKINEGKPTKEESRTLYHVQKLLASGEYPEEVSTLLDELRQKMERKGDSIREMIYFALKNKDKNVMREAIRMLESLVQGKFRATPTSDRAINELLERGEGTIFVGSGSLGGRIHITRDALSMHEDKEEYDGDVRKKFQELFNLPEQELTVSLEKAVGF